MQSAIKVIALLLSVVSLSGCAMLKRTGSIKIPGASVVGVQDAGKPATLASDVKWEGMVLPKGSSLTLTKFQALAGQPASTSGPAIQAQPAKEVAQITVSENTEWKRSENIIKADTGTVDTSIAAKRIESEESRPLLYAALASIVGAGVCLWLKYPTPALICGASSVVFFLAWKVSGLPSWFWAVGAVGLAGAAALYLGHEKGERHAAESLPTSK